jgi:hypothetical protein
VISKEFKEGRKEGREGGRKEGRKEEICGKNCRYLHLRGRGDLEGIQGIQGKKEGKKERKAVIVGYLHLMRGIGDLEGIEGRKRGRQEVKTGIEGRNCRLPPFERDR